MRHAPSPGALRHDREAVVHFRDTRCSPRRMLCLLALGPGPHVTGERHLAILDADAHAPRINPGVAFERGFDLRLHVRGLDGVVTLRGNVRLS
jgi:hypothetical protein